MLSDYSSFHDKRYGITSYQWKNADRTREEIERSQKALRESSDCCDEKFSFTWDLAFGKLINGCPSGQGRINHDNLLNQNQKLLYMTSPITFQLGTPNKGKVAIDNNHTYHGFQYPFCNNIGLWWNLEPVSCNYSRISLDANKNFRYMYASRDRGNIYLDEFQNTNSYKGHVYQDQQLWEIIQNSTGNAVYIFNKYREQFLTHENSRNLLLLRDEPYGWELII